MHENNAPGQQQALARALAPALQVCHSHTSHSWVAAHLWTGYSLDLCMHPLLFATLNTLRASDRSTFLGRLMALEVAFYPLA
jgi:hypothetical protein